MNRTRNLVNVLAKISLVTASAALLAACSGDAHLLNSNVRPTNPVVIFPNNPERTVTTAIESNSGASQAGVDGTVLDIVTFKGANPYADNLTINADGDLGVRGSVHARGSISTVSHRSAKTEIAPFAGDPLALLDRTKIVTYRYRGEPRSEGRHIGFIAEDTPTELSGPGHDRYDVTNTVAVNIAATKRLQIKMSRLEKQIAVLEAELAARDRETSGSVAR